MLKNKRFRIFAPVLAIILLVVSVFGFSQPASAHFIVEDTNTGVKALFHVTPDHSPIAGEESIISFDFAETDVQAAQYSYTLTVKSTKEEAVSVPVDVSGNVVLAPYTFPTQGFYTIRLTATHKADGTVSELQYGQRVSRGEVAERDGAFLPIEIIAIGGVTAIAVGAIIYSFINDSKRKEKKNEANHNE